MAILANPSLVGDGRQRPTEAAGSDLQGALAVSARPPARAALRSRGDVGVLRPPF